MGACYLFYLGITTFLSKPSISINSDATKYVSWKKIYLQGLITNALNPKVALFFLAFLPQFIVPSSDYSIAAQVLLLGLIFNCSGTIINLVVAYFFGSAKKWLSSHPMILQIQHKISGFILIGLGTRLVVLEKG